MNIWIVLAILVGVSLVMSSIGFKKFVWFLSIGYGFAILGCGIAIGVIYGVEGHLNLTGLIACILFVIYGFRLGGFLLLRELKNASYRKTLEEATKTEKKIPPFVLVTMWIMVSILYMLQTSSVAFVLEMRQASSFLDVSVMEIIGVCIMALGIFIEGLADHQKTKQKKENPHMVATKGLYKICRCPNYYGEILNWTGVFLFFFSIVSKACWWMWIFVVLAYICIVYIMFNGAKRLEGRQQKNYGEKEEFKAYISKTPILIYLLIPVKSLLNSKLVK